MSRIGRVPLAPAAWHCAVATFCASVSIACSDYGFGRGKDPADGSCFDRTYGGEPVEEDEFCEFPEEMGNVGNVLDWSLSRFQEDSEHSGVSMAPIVASVTDDNGDGDINDLDTPDILAISYREGRGILRAVSGDDKTEHWSAGDINLQPQGGLAAGDLDGDGIVEIVALTADERVVLFEHDGSLIWTSDSVALHIFGDSDYPAIGNMDGQGAPEITVGRVILDADGNILGHGGQGRGGERGSASFPVDLDGDGQQELVVGNALYTMTGDSIWEIGEADGYPAVADLNGDGEPEIVVSSSGEVRAQSAVDGTILWDKRVTGATASGAPTLADFDGDGEPEVAVVTTAELVVFDGDGTKLWSVNNNPTACNTDCHNCSGFTDQSGRIGLTAFDFDGGGITELLLIDQTRLWIFAGDTGNPKMCSDMHESPTHMEYAMVADANGDGIAEIVSPGAPPDGADNNSTNQGLKLFKSVSDDWAAGRRIWNQYAYHITNINDDGTVPDAPANNWATFNNFRSGAVTASSGLLAPDLFGEWTDICTGECQEDRLVFWIQAGNRGLADVPGDVEISMVLDSNDGSDPVVLESTVLSGGLDAGELSESIRLEIQGVSDVDLSNLAIHVDGGNWATWDGAWKECNEGNNEESWEGRLCE